MDKQIRRGLFETNSSSMHSVSIIGGNKYTDKNKLYVSNNEIIVTGGEYGWDGPECRTPREKLDYIVTSIYLKGYEVEGTEYFQWLSEMVEDYTGYPLRFLGSDEDEYGSNGMSIDHESSGTISYFFSYDDEQFKEKMKELVFNEKYSIIIANDNDYF